MIICRTVRQGSTRVWQLLRRTFLQNLISIARHLLESKECTEMQWYCRFSHLGENLYFVIVVWFVDHWKPLLWQWVLYIVLWFLLDVIKILVQKICLMLLISTEMTIVPILKVLLKLNTEHLVLLGDFSIHIDRVPLTRMPLNYSPFFDLQSGVIPSSAAISTQLGNSHCDHYYLFQLTHNPPPYTPVFRALQA